MESLVSAWAPLSPIEISILFAALAVVGLGIPLLMKSIRMPRRMEIVPVPAEALTPAQRAWLDGLGDRLRPEGFSEALTFSAVNLPSQNLCRAWVSDAFPTMVMATLAKHANDEAVTHTRYIEAMTEFADGSADTTRTAAIEDLFDLLPGHRCHLHRGSSHPADLLRAHAQHVQSRAGKQPVHHGHDDFALLLNGFHERWVAHQVSRGLLVPTPAGDFAPTLRLALRGVRAFFSPFGEGTSYGKLAAALTGGFALPLLAWLALLDARVPIVAGLESAVGLGYAASLAVAMLPVMWLAGMLMGFALPNNTFVWPAICAWAGSRLLLAEVAGDWLATSIWLGALLGVPVFANRGSRLHARWRGLL